jgi:hypothetical protein
VLRFSEIDPEDVPDTYRLLEKLGNQGPAAMLPEEVLALVRAGADLDLVMAGPIPQSQVQAILRKIAVAGIDALTPEEIGGLRRSFVRPQSSAPAAASDMLPAEAGQLPFTQEGKELIGVGGRRLEPFGDGERFRYVDDGTVVDVYGNVLGRSPGDLTSTTDVADDLENSATPITTDAASPRYNLPPNAVRQDKIDSLAERIRSATAEQRSTDPIARRTLKDLQTQVSRLNEAEREALLSHPALAAGIESVDAKRIPERRQAAIAAAQQRLDTLAEMAEVPDATRAGQQLTAARNAREVAAASRAGSADAAAAGVDVRTARQRVEEAMPEGDWNALASAFNAMPAERREAVLARLSSGRSLEPMTGGRGALDPSVFKEPRKPGDAPLRLDSGATASRPHPMGLRRGPEDQTAARPFIEKRLSRGTDGPAFDPNAVAELLRGGNEMEQALIRLDSAMRSGDEAAIAAARDVVDDIRTRPADTDEARQAMEEMISDARTSFLQRQQAASELRRAIVGTDPDYLAEQERLLRSSVAPAPRPGIAPGARTPVTVIEDIGQANMPTAFDEGVAVNRAREEALDRRAVGGGVPEEVRKGMFPDGNIPLAFKGDDSATPLEVRPIRERLPDTRDRDAVAAARTAEDSLTAALAEMQSAKGAEALARAQQKVTQAQRELDKLYPPRLVEQRTGRVQRAPAGMRSEDVPKGWVLERGRPAYPDSMLNRESIQSVRDNLVMKLVGRRPRAAYNLNRASDELSAAERAILNADARRQLDATSNVPDDVIPESPDDEVSALGQQGKRGRLGGSRRESDIQQALGALYGTSNPLGREAATTGGFTYVPFETAEQLADDLLAGQTVFKPGDKGFEQDRAAIIRALEDYFGPQNRNESALSEMGQRLAAAENAELPQPPSPGARSGTDQDPSRIPVEQGTWPEGTMRQQAGAGPTPGTNVRAEPPARPTLAGIDEAAADLTAFPRRRRSGMSDAEMEAERFPDASGKAIRGNKPSPGKKLASASAEDQKLEASATDISDIDGDPAPAGKNAASAASRSDEDIIKDIDQEGQEVYDQTYRNYIDMGDGEDEARTSARDAASKYINEQRQLRIKPIKGDAAPASSDPAPASPAPADVDPPAATAATPAAAADAPQADRIKPVRLADADQIDAPETAVAKKAADDTPQSGQPEAKNKGQKKRGKWPWIVGTAAVGGTLGGLARINSGGGGFIDIPIPAGGSGGGPGGGGGDFYPIPVRDGASVPMDDQLEQEAAIQRALDRIRGSRGGGPQTYQTYQNYLFGR